MAGYIPGAPSSPDSGRDDVDDSDDVDDGGSGRGSDDRVLTPSSPDEPTSTTGSGSDRGSGYSSDDDGGSSSSSSGTDDRVVSPEGLTTTKGAASGATSSGDTTTADGDPASQPNREMDDAVRERNADADASINLADPTARAFIPGLAGDTRAAERQSAEQFGDIETRYLTGGNRRDEDVLSDYSDEYESSAQAAVQGTIDYGPVGGGSDPYSQLVKLSRNERAVLDLAEDLGFGDEVDAVEGFSGDPTKGPIEGYTESLGTGILGVGNVPEQVLGLKEVGEFVVTQPGRVLTPRDVKELAEAGIAVDAAMKNPAAIPRAAEEIAEARAQTQTSAGGRKEFAEDIGERADAVATASIESFRSDPVGTAGELTGGLAAGVLTGTVAGRGLRKVSGGRVGGSDLSGAALTKSVDATRRVKTEVDEFRNAERGQADLTGPSRNSDIDTSSVDASKNDGRSSNKDVEEALSEFEKNAGELSPDARELDAAGRPFGQPSGSSPPRAQGPPSRRYRRTEFDVGAPTDDLREVANVERRLADEARGGPLEVDPSTLGERSRRQPTTGSDLVDPVESFEDLDGGLQQQAQAAEVTAAGVGGATGAGLGFSGTFGDGDTSPEIRVATDVDQDTETDLDQDITTDVDEDVDIDQDTDIRTDTDVQTDVDDDTRFDSPTRYDSPETDLRVDTRLDSEARIDAETRSDSDRRRDLDLDLQFGDVEDDSLESDLDGFDRAIKNAIADPEDILSGRAFGRY